jgi:hypothetical protein
MHRDLHVGEQFCYGGRQLQVSAQAPPHSASPQGAALKLEAVRPHSDPAKNM